MIRHPGGDDSAPDMSDERVLYFHRRYKSERESVEYVIDDVVARSRGPLSLPRSLISRRLKKPISHSALYLIWLGSEFWTSEPVHFTAYSLATKMLNEIDHELSKSDLNNLSEKLGALFEAASCCELLLYDKSKADYMPVFALSGLDSLMRLAAVVALEQGLKYDPE